MPKIMQKNTAIFFPALALCLALLLADTASAQPQSCVYLPPDGAALAGLPAALQPAVVAAKRAARRISVKQATGAWQALVLLIDFPDYPWFAPADSNFNFPDSLFTREYYKDMLFSDGTFKDPLSQSAYTGSMRDYYREVSYGAFDLSGVVTHWLRAAHPLKYYVNADGRGDTSDDFGFGRYPRNAAGLVEEALLAADSSVDFSRFDNDGDGFVDALFVVHAGPGAEELYIRRREASYNYFWSHAASIRPLALDEVQITHYTLEPENGSIGVFCHEFGHALGLPDLYDVDRSSEGIGEWGLMGGGGWCFRAGDRAGTGPVHFSAWSKMKLGWIVPAEITADQDRVSLQPVARFPDILRVHSPAMPENEYFLLENRQPLDFDAGLTRRQKNFSLPDPAGLLIWHIDEARGSQPDESRRMVDVEEATPYIFPGGARIFENLDGVRDLDRYQFLNTGNRGDNGDLFPGFAGFNATLTDFAGPRSRNRFDDTTIPAARTNDGLRGGVAVYDIELDGDKVSLSIRFDHPTSVAGTEVQPRAWSLTVTPNPLRSFGAATVRLTAGSPAGTGELRLYDLLGRLITARKIATAPDSETRLSLSTLLPAAGILPRGVYFLRFLQGQIRLTQKILLVEL